MHRGADLASKKATHENVLYQHLQQIYRIPPSNNKKQYTLQIMHDNGYAVRVGI